MHVYYYPEYSPIPQENNPDKYISCEVFAGQTVAPSSDKVCRQTTAQFGQHCLNKRFYGILDGSPCILLVLKLVNINSETSLNHKANE